MLSARRRNDLNSSKRIFIIVTKRFALTLSYYIFRLLMVVASSGKMFELSLFSHFAVVEKET